MKSRKNPHPYPGRPPASTPIGNEGPAERKCILDGNKVRKDRWRAKYNIWKAWEDANPKPCCQTCGKEI